MGKRPNFNPDSTCMLDHCPQYDDNAIIFHKKLLQETEGRAENFCDIVHPSDFPPEKLERLAKKLAENRKKDADLKKKFHT